MTRQMTGAVTAFKTRENVRIRRVGWMEKSDRAMTGDTGLMAIVHHRRAAHNGNEDSNCPACREILKKAGLR